MFNDQVSDRKIPAYPGNGEIRIRWFNPPISLPKIDEHGDAVVIDGIPQLEEYKFLVDGNAEILDEDGGHFGTRPIDGSRLPENIRVLAGAIAEEVNKGLVDATPNMQMAVAPKHPSRISTFEKQFGKSAEKLKKAREKAATLKAKAEQAAQKRAESAEFGDGPNRGNSNQNN